MRIENSYGQITQKGYHGVLIVKDGEDHHMYVVTFKTCDELDIFVKNTEDMPLKFIDLDVKSDEHSITVNGTVYNCESINYME